MKPAQPFIIEIKRNGRRHVRVEKPLFDPVLLRAAMEDVEDAREEAENPPPKTEK